MGKADRFFDVFGYRECGGLHSWRKFLGAVCHLTALVSGDLNRYYQGAMVKPVLLLVVVIMLADVCGYKRAGKGDALPKDIKILAVPIFQNSSLKYRVEGRFTQAVMDEILKRARALHVTTNTDGADATLTGDIRSFRAGGTILDQQGRTRVWSLRIILSVTIRDNNTRKILYQNPRLIFEGEYELSDAPESFFNEENGAVDRIAKDFAQTIVSTILEGK